MADICMRCILFREVDPTAITLRNALLPQDLLANYDLNDGYFSKHPFLSYAATYWAVHYRDGRMHSELAARLLERDKETYDWIVDKDCQTLQRAVDGRHTQLVSLLLTKGVDVNAEGGNWGNALQAAAYFADDRTLELLLENGVELSRRTEWKVLRAAIERGDQQIVQILLNHGASPQAQGLPYGTCLHAAASCGHDTLVHLFLELGINVNASGGQWATALQAAANNAQFSTLELLLAEGADVNAQGGHFGNALQAAVDNGDKDVIRLLLRKGTNVNMQGGPFGNSLQAAADRGDLEIVQMLLHAGADINATGGPNGTAYQTALKRKHVLLIPLLLQKKRAAYAQSAS